MDNSGAAASFHAQIEFVFMHNARTRKIPLMFIMKNKERFRGRVMDFDPYHILLDDAELKILLSKNDIATVAAAKTVVDIDFISKIYYSAHQGRHPKHTRPPMQDIFLNEVRKSRSPIVSFLINGVKIRGNLIGFDNYTLLTAFDGRQQLVYKNTISTIYPVYQMGEIIKYDGER